MNNVIQIEFKHGYIFYVRFDDGTSGNIDFKEYLERGHVFKPLKNPAFFKQAQIQGGTISWPNGADIAPETLYEKIQNTKPQ